MSRVTCSDQYAIFVYSLSKSSQNLISCRFWRLWGWPLGHGPRADFLGLTNGVERLVGDEEALEVHVDVWGACTEPSERDDSRK